LRDGLLGDLDEDFLARLQKICDGGKRWPLGAVSKRRSRGALSAFRTVASIGAIRPGFSDTRFVQMDDGRSLGLRIDLIGRIGIEGWRNAGAVVAHIRPRFPIIGAIAGTAAATATTAASLEACTTIPFAEGGGEAMRLAGGFRAAFDFSIDNFFRSRIEDIVLLCLAGSFGLFCVVFGDQFFGGELSGIGFIVVVFSFREEYFARFFNGVDVFKFSLIDVIREFGKGSIDVLGESLFDDYRGRFGIGRRLDRYLHGSYGLRCDGCFDNFDLLNDFRLRGRSDIEHLDFFRALEFERRGLLRHVNDFGSFNRFDGRGGKRGGRRRDGWPAIFGE